MEKSRYRGDRARSRQSCFTCQALIEANGQFVWDNLLSTKLCMRCFQQNSNTTETLPSQPKPTELPLTEETCPICHEERLRRRPSSPECGTLEEWIDRIHLETEKEPLLAVWDVANTIQWTKLEQLRLGRVYVNHLANIISLELWNKPINSSKLFASTAKPKPKESEYKINIQEVPF